MDNQAQEQLQQHQMSQDPMHFGENKRQLLRYQNQDNISYNRFKLFKSKDKVAKNIDKAHSPQLGFLKSRDIHFNETFRPNDFLSP